MDNYDVSQVKAWLSEKSINVELEVTGAQLLAYSRRDFAKIPDFRAAKKLQFELEKERSKLSSVAEQEEAHKREQLVAAKMQQLSKQQQDGDAAPSSTASTTSESASNAGLLISWDIAQVSNWVSQVIGRQDPALLAGVDGKTLCEVGIRKSIGAAKVSMIERRKLEHAFAQLNQVVQEEAQKNAKRFHSRVDVDADTSLTRQVTHHHFPGSGVYLFISKSKVRVVLEVENVSKVPIIAICKLTMDNCKPSGQPKEKNFVLPVDANKLNKKIEGLAAMMPGGLGTAKADDASSSRHQIAEISAIDKAKPWHVEFDVSFQEATMLDWSAVKSAEHAQKAAVFQGAGDIDVIKKTCRAAGIKFTDPAFPPTLASLYLDPEKPPPRAVAVEWKRPSQFLKDPPVLFAQPITPTDIKQGRLGDCWFITALVTIASQPQHILKLFKSLEYSPEGIYHLQFFRNGKWVDVVVDDYLPCTPNTGFLPWDVEQMVTMGTYLQGTHSHTSGGPVYARTQPVHSIWVNILEKGYAKLNNSYQAICSGTLCESLYDVLGAPCVTLFFPWLNDEEKSWTVMYEAHTSNQMMGCSTRMLTEEERASGFQLEKFGIVGRHAYSILSLVTVGLQRFIKIRNPWGTFDWNGKYGPRDSQWNNYSAAIKKALDYGAKTENGSFWMSFADFMSFFDEVTICKVGALTDWTANQFSGMYTPENGLYGPQFRVMTKQTQTCLIQITKQDVRHAVGADRDNRQGIYLMEERDGGQLISVGSSGNWSRREVTLQAELEAGKTYVIVVLAQIGNIKYTEISWELTVFSPLTLDCMQLPSSAQLLMKSILADMSHNYGNKKRMTSEFFSLMHFLYYDDNRTHVQDAGGIPLILRAIEVHFAERELCQIACSVVWNLACSPAIRPHLLDAIPVLKQVAQRHGSVVELCEVVDCALRNIALGVESTSVAMDPLIEEAIIAGVCTYTVTGDKVFLLQSWYDCLTCNLRSKYGLCAVCATTCHKGHELSPPKFSRFYCDCGGGKVETLPACLCVKSSQESGLWKKRSRDAHHFNPDEDEEEKKKKEKKGRKRTGVVTLNT